MQFQLVNKLPVTGTAQTVKDPVVISDDESDENKSKKKKRKNKEKAAGRNKRTIGTLGGPRNVEHSETMCHQQHYFF